MLPLFYYSLFTDAEGINPSGHVSVVGVFISEHIQQQYCIRHWVAILIYTVSLPLLGV